MNIDKSFKVFCLVLGDPTPFPVHPLREDDVGDLRILIKKAREDSILRGADPHKLVLWHVGPFNAQHELADPPGSSTNLNQ